VSTGVTTPTLCESLDIFQRQSNTLQCSACGELHQWDTAIAYFVDDDPLVEQIKA
jgi:hypothetical protein